MRIIFLDFDGVLNCEASFRRDRSPLSIWEPCMKQLERIHQETGASVVVSSSWRAFWPLEEITTLLWAYGYTGEVLGETPLTLSYRPRGQEIQECLEFNCQPETFVILDDENDMEGLMPHLVQTDFERGLTEADADRAIAHLLREVSA